jgi:subtilisin family serine protease
MTEVGGRIVVVLKRVHAAELERRITAGEIADVSSLHDAAVALGANGAALASLLDSAGYAGVKSAIPNKSHSVRDQIRLDSTLKTRPRRSLVGVFALNATVLNEERRKQLVADLRSLNTLIDAAYIESSHAVGAHVAKVNPAHSFVDRQTYLNNATEGIGALPVKHGGHLGGTGVGLALVDLDLIRHHEALGGADPKIHVGKGHFSVNTDKVHGTAALGVILSPLGKPITGIAPGAELKSVAKPGASDPELLANAIATAIDAAAADLEEGDVLLIELQDGDRPVEVNVEVFAAIQAATAKGIVVIEPAGNGGFELEGLAGDMDNAPAWNLEDEPKIPIPDSGAIMVSGCTLGHEHHRVLICNHGDRVDCYAIGEYVVSAGAVDHVASLVDTIDHNKWYDDLFFNGTSLASAIIAGVVLRIQDMARHTPGIGRPLDAYQIRDLLKSPEAGTPITFGAKRWFMPNLDKMQPLLDKLAKTMGPPTPPFSHPVLS